MQSFRTEVDYITWMQPQVRSVLHKCNVLSMYSKSATSHLSEAPPAFIRSKNFTQQSILQAHCHWLFQLKLDYINFYWLGQSIGLELLSASTSSLPCAFWTLSFPLIKSSFSVGASNPDIRPLLTNGMGISEIGTGTSCFCSLQSLLSRLEMESLRQNRYDS